LARPADFLFAQTLRARTKEVASREAFSGGKKLTMANPPSSTVSPHDLALAHALARLGIGVAFLGHGLARIGNVQGFSDSLVTMFAQSPLPAPVVAGFGHIVPALELVFGIVLILGWYLRPALIAILLFMCVLELGVTLIQNWTLASEQLIYIAFLAALLATANWNRFSMDGVSRRK
jgi:thiosulfate dehydrogenase [quinone] large subunit